MSNDAVIFIDTSYFINTYPSISFLPLIQFRVIEWLAPIPAVTGQQTV